MPVFSTKPLTAGEVIYECKPLVHCIDNELKGKVCDNCLKQSDQLKRCLNCLQMYYCSEECQQMDWEYHKNECKLYRSNGLDTNAILGLGRLCLRLYIRIKTDETFATNMSKPQESRKKKKKTTTKAETKPKPSQRREDWCECEDNIGDQIPQSVCTNRSCDHITNCLALGTGCHRPCMHCPTCRRHIHPAPYPFHQ